jgi:hypothetical protein
MFDQHYWLLPKRNGGSGLLIEPNAGCKFTVAQLIAVRQEANEKAGGTNLSQNLASECLDSIDPAVQGSDADRGEHRILEVLKEGTIGIPELPGHEGSVRILLVN